MRALVVLALVVPVGIVTMYVVNLMAKARVEPSRELANAVRLLDKAMACDDVMPYMSSEVRQEIRAVLDRYKGRGLR